MAEFEAQIDSIQAEMDNFLRAKARGEPTPSHPIFLKSEYKNNLRLLDSQNRHFQVDESFLSAFRDVYTDKNCIPLPTQSRRSNSAPGSSNCLSSVRPALASPS